MKQQVALAGYLLLLSVAQVFAQTPSQNLDVDGRSSKALGKAFEAEVQEILVVGRSAASNMFNNIEYKEAVIYEGAGHSELDQVEVFEHVEPVDRVEPITQITQTEILSEANVVEQQEQISVADEASIPQEVEQPAQIENIAADELHTQETLQKSKPKVKFLDSIKEKFTRTSHKVGTQWADFADDLDQSLGGESYNKNSGKPNASYLRLQLGQTWSKGGDLDTDVRLRARLDLPNSKRRLRLLLDNTDELNQSLEQEALGRTDNDNNVQSAALQLTLAEDSKWKTSASAGVRDLPLNPFVRVTVKRRYLLDFIAKDLQGRFKTSVNYSKDDKLFADSFYLFSIPRNEMSTWNNRIKAKWKDSDNEIEFANIVSYDKRIDSDRNYTHSVGVIFSNRPDVRATDYFLQSTYRKHLYGNILYFSVTPALEFPREDDFKATPSINAKLSFYFRRR